MATVSPDQIAQALNLSEQRVHQLVKKGMPKEARGQYDPVKCMLWYIRYLQKAIEKKTLPILDGRFVAVREQRVRLLRVLADLKELEVSKMRSQLVSIEDVEREMTHLVRTTTAQVMAIVPRIANELVGQTSLLVIQAKIDKAVRETLSQLARSRNGGGNP